LNDDGSEFDLRGIGGYTGFFPVLLLLLYFGRRDCNVKLESPRRDGMRKRRRRSGRKRERGKRGGVHDMPYCKTTDTKSNNTSNNSQ
jgi:hypothetical protein